jgi:hypothetical protein
MLVLGVVAIGGGGYVLTRHADTEAGIYLRRMGGIMACAFGAVLVIAAITLNGALA